MPAPSTTETRPSPIKVIVAFVLLYLAVYAVRLVMGVVPNLLMRQLGASPDFRAYIGSTLNYGVGIVAYILFPAIALRRVLHIDPWPRFFPFRGSWWSDLLVGLLLVGVVLGLFFIAMLGFGWLALDGWKWQALPRPDWLRIAWVGLLVNVGVAIGEETLFRGYLLTGLRAAWGKWTALIVMTVVFGLFHLPAYFEDGMDSAALTLAIVLASLFGLLFGLVYLRTGTLWLPASLHFAWNFIENDLLNLTADSTNQNLVGALTRLQAPLQAGSIAVVLVETLAFCLIAVCIWLWLRGLSPRQPRMES